MKIYGIMLFETKCTPGGVRVRLVEESLVFLVDPIGPLCCSLRKSDGYHAQHHNHYLFCGATILNFSERARYAFAH